MQLTDNIAIWIDLVIFILIAFSLLIGWARGFVREAISLATWVAAAAFAVFYFKKLAELLPFNVQSEVVRLIVAAAIIFFAVLIAGAFINYVFNSVVEAIGLKGVNHFLGALFGFLRGALIVILAVILLDLANLSDAPWWNESHLLGIFNQWAAKLQDMMPEEFSMYLKSLDPE